MPAKTDQPKIWEPTAEEKIDWLSKCESIDRGAKEYAWQFKFLYYDGDDGVAPSDVVISPRGVNELSEAIASTMRLERGLGKK